MAEAKIASRPVGHPAGFGESRQKSKMGARSIPPSPAGPMGSPSGGWTTVMSPGSTGTTGPTGAGVAPEATGAGVDDGPPPLSAGIGSTSGPMTSGGTPPGGKAHIARTRPPPNEPANWSTTDAGHQSPW